ncbi:MAG: hypothetical protein GXO91_07050 [FCB group bacterium]|nr:hypothetical protein [FCB group bacterium]
MKKLFIFIVLILSVSIVTAQAGKSSCCKKGKAGKTEACDKKGAMSMEASAQMDAAGLEKAEAPCPNLAAGEKCDNPENCAHLNEGKDSDHETHAHKRSWWNFWGSKADKDCCKKP